ncbi:MAG: hypothetical protein ACO35Q_12400 [Prochlorothrix sp.]
MVCCSRWLQGSIAVCHGVLLSVASGSDRPPIVPNLLSHSRNGVVSAPQLSQNPWDTVGPFWSRIAVFSYGFLSFLS